MLIASRLAPRRTSTTWFSSGRAAFAFLLSEVVQPDTVYLPTYVCWSLIDVMQQRFPDVQLKFYSVSRDLSCSDPAGPDERAAIVVIHYFGHRNNLCCESRSTVLEDQSHLPWRYFEDHTNARRYVFGSLRKSYCIADGGFVEGEFNPVYEPSRKLDTWLRLAARDWRDLREAENMTDRRWSLADISSQSLTVVLQTDIAEMTRRRQDHDLILQTHIGVGRPFISFASDECPLLHNRIFDSTEERESLRQFLANKQIFTSVHWPVHQYLLERQDEFDCHDAIWLERHLLSIPIAEYYQPCDMERICDAAHDWQTAGSIRFPSPSACVGVR